MQLDSTNAKHKLFIVALLMAVFAIPFAWQWQSLTSVDSRAVIAGGAVIGAAASENEATTIPTNHSGQMTISSGRSFAGALAQ